jgi:hypothetical protein
MKLSSHDIKRKIERGEIKVEYSAKTREEKLRPWIKKVLQAINKPDIFVTSDSVIRDVLSKEERTVEKSKEISEKLRVPVSMKESIFDIANKIRVGHYPS